MADRRHPVAVRLRDPEQLYGILAAFYALGIRRNGWVVHISRPGRVASDRERLNAAGFDVARHEPSGQFAIGEFDLAEAPAIAGVRWVSRVHEELEKGYSGVWYSRVTVSEEVTTSWDAHEREWEQTIAHAVVSLAPYIASSAGSETDRARPAGTVVILQGDVMPGAAAKLHRRPPTPA